MRRRLSENFPLAAVPVICLAVTGYFGYSGIFGERGIVAWQQTQARLEIERRELADVRAKREALEHRIALLNDKAIDPDLLEEIARGELLQSRPGEVAVPREKH